MQFRPGAAASAADITAGTREVMVQPAAPVIRCLLDILSSERGIERGLIHGHCWETLPVIMCTHITK